MAFIDREFAGETRRFQLPVANPIRLYRGLEAEGVGNLQELARRVELRTLGASHVEAVLSHALSRGHPLTLMRMRDLVREQMTAKPLVEFLPLTIDIISAALVGDEE